MKSLITLALLLAGSSIAMAASMITPEVQFSFYSKDGIPVEGVGITGHLRYESLTTEDCSGFICMPSAPRYKSTSEAGAVLGVTDSQGNLTIAPQKRKAKAFTARKLEFVVFTNGLVWDACNDQDKTQADILDLLPQFLNGQPVQRNDECVSLAGIESDKVLKMVCYSPFTAAEIQAKKQSVLAKCK